VEALRFAFSVLKQGTVLEQAEFEYLTPPLILHCGDCETQYVGQDEDLRCPVCEGENFQVVQGREMKVKSILGV
jgi:hydrogenase nickel incorporation protein HypA/HybF